MEEIYIVKLKGLPPPTGTSQESLSKDSKNSFYYQDLTAEAIRGFSYLHIFFGLTVLCLSVTNLCFHENPLSLEPPLGITIWCAIAFLFLGIFGIVTAYKRRCDLSRSIFYVKIHFVVIIIVLSMTLTFVILFAFDLHGPIANQFIGLNIFFSIIVETVILLLTLFTCARVLWPGCMNFCAKDWPMQPKLKRKVIVKTNVFANGIQQDDSNMIQSVGPNCVISLNMPPLTTDNPQSVSPSPSSSAPSLAYTKEMAKSALSSASSDLTNSSSSLYSTSGEQSGLTDERNNEITGTTIATRSVYHGGINMINSYPLSATSNARMQTFRKDPQSSHSNLYGNTNRLLYEHSNLFKKRSYLENNSCSFNREYSGNEHEESSGLEEVDPYDTDEFDYCTTDDEEHETDHRLALEDCHKSSSDEGNGTLEEDNKSSVHSDQLSSTRSDIDLRSTECYPNRRSILECDTDLRFQATRFKEKMDVVIKMSPRVEVAQSQLESQCTDNALADSDGNETTCLANSKSALVSADRLSLDEPEDDDEHDEGISSSGSSTCSAELGQPVSSPFSNRLRLQTCRSKHPYKSSIKIGSNCSSTPCSEVESPNKSALSSTSTRVTTVSGTSECSAKETNIADSIPTIRLLTTKSTPSQPKQKIRIDLTGSNESSISCTDSSTLSSVNGGKLASHPYLCRLRASNVDLQCYSGQSHCDDRLPRRLDTYPKYVSNTQLSSSSTTLTSTSCTNKTVAAPANLTVSFHEPNRIPDIQRV